MSTSASSPSGHNRVPLTSQQLGDLHVARDQGTLPCDASLLTQHRGTVSVRHMILWRPTGPDTTFVYKVMGGNFMRVLGETIDQPQLELLPSASNSPS